VAKARERCWRNDWVLDLHIKGLLRQHRLGADAQGVSASYRLFLDAALRRALVAIARADGGWPASSRARRARHRAG
jgi:hypothetical protein